MLALKKPHKVRLQSSTERERKSSLINLKLFLRKFIVKSSHTLPIILFITTA
jgi:hypothetical protein